MHRLTSASRRTALQERAKGALLIADNGVKRHIDKVLKTFAGRAKELSHQTAATRRLLGHIPRGAEVPAAIHAAATALAEEVVTACTELSDGSEWQNVLSQQASIDPTHVIALEDFVVTCLIGLSLEQETLRWSPRRIDARNKRSLMLWNRYANDPRMRGRRVYVTLGAFDYNSAVSAGRLAAKRGAEYVALGMAGILLDNNAVDFVTTGSRTRTLVPPVLRRYVRFAQVVRGIRDGYAKERKILRAFHALGLGAPVMFPLLAAALDMRTELSADATSPIHDAVRDRVIYDYRNRGDRLSLRAIVSRIVRGRRWACSTPFCKTFSREHTHDEIAARAWWRGAGEPLIDDAVMVPGSILSASLPLLVRSTTPINRKAQLTHIAHNHAIVKALSRAVPSDRTRAKWARQQLNRLTRTRASVIANALKAAADIATG